MAVRSSCLRAAFAFGPLVAVCLAAGCAKPSAPAEQFIATWIAAPPGADLKPGTYPTLTLASDGTGVYTEYPVPHPINVNWVLRGDKLVMANRDGSGSMTYSYRFNNKDELVIIMEGREVKFRRYEEAARGTAESREPKVEE